MSDLRAKTPTDGEGTTTNGGEIHTLPCRICETPVFESTTRVRPVARFQLPVKPILPESKGKSIPVVAALDTRATVQRFCSVVNQMNSES